MVVFDFFPQIKALGRSRIQELCSEWAATGDAVRLDVTGIEVGDESTSMAIVLKRIGLGGPIGDKLYMLLKSLFDYIIDHGLTGEAAAVSRLHAAGFNRTAPPARFPNSGAGVGGAINPSPTPSQT